MSDADVRRALIEQAHQLHELTKHPGWPILVDYANDQIMRPMKYRVLNDGNIPELAEYKKLAGFLMGMHRALDIPAEVEKLAANARSRAAAEHTPEPEAA